MDDDTRIALRNQADARRVWHLKLWLACDHLPSDNDCLSASMMLTAYKRDARAYRAGLIDDPRPNPEMTLFGVLGIIVMRIDGQQVFVPSAMVTLCGCCDFDGRRFRQRCDAPSDIPL